MAIYCDYDGDGGGGGLKDEEWAIKFYGFDSCHFHSNISGFKWNTFACISEFYWHK